MGSKRRTTFVVVGLALAMVAGGLAFQAGETLWSSLGAGGSVASLVALVFVWFETRASQEAIAAATRQIQTEVEALRRTAALSAVRELLSAVEPYRVVLSAESLDIERARFGVQAVYHRAVALRSHVERWTSTELSTFGESLRDLGTDLTALDLPDLDSPDRLLRRSLLRNLRDAERVALTLQARLSDV